ncbi:uncharacterized protein EAE98_006520 [Botrytis deweyae]|uniref:Mediator of RNA polymerase II transcription subunit 22 n=1 Tax=Botrytis deweyae TaxID=2478750 RepID=A0ABQ7IJU2_9HELO|nr:uncharacterized protein EAE98_006520 [Botrytis deweyae]KAF7926225.1 hypothetical protein EAE98_006520 [Botrytis deweyae]
MSCDRDPWDSSRGEIIGTVSGNSIATSDSTRINEDNAIDSSTPSRPGFISRTVSSDYNMANDSIRIDEGNAANFMAPPGSEHMSGAPASYPTSHLTGINESSVTDTSNPASPGPISRMLFSDSVMTNWPMVSDSSMNQSTDAVATEPMSWLPGPEVAMPYSSDNQFGNMPPQPIGALTYGLNMPPQPIGSTGGNTSSTRLPYYGVGMHPLLVNSTAESTSSTRMPYHGVGMHPLLVDSTSGNASSALPNNEVSMRLQSPIQFASENITNPSLLNEYAANEVVGFVEPVFNNHTPHQGAASLGLPREATTANELVFDNGTMRQEGSSAQMTQNGLHMEVSLNFEDASIPGLLNEVTATTQPISNNEMLRQNDSYAQVAQNDMSMGNLLGNGNESRVSLFNAFGANEFSELPELDFGNSTLHQDDPNPNLPNELTANEFAELPEVVLDNGMLHQDGLRPNLFNEVTAITEPVASKEAASITGQVANNEFTAATESVAEDERPSQNDPVHKHGSVHNDGSADNLAEIRRSKADELTDRQERAIAALLIRFQNLVKLAALPTEDAFTKETAAAEGLRMEVESNALTSAAEDLLKLTRELKEFWIFGSLRGIGEGEGDGEMETDSKKVAELIEKQLEKKHEQEKNKV